MRYISDDGKVFNTEQECLLHENIEKRRVEDERIRKEKVEKERKTKLDIINQRYNELQKLVYEYGKEYGADCELYFMPFCELARILG